MNRIKVRLHFNNNFIYNFFGYETESNVQMGENSISTTTDFIIKPLIKHSEQCVRALLMIAALDTDRMELMV